MLTVTEPTRCGSGQRWGSGVKQAAAWRKSETQENREERWLGQSEERLFISISTLTTVRGIKC